MKYLSSAEYVHSTTGKILRKIYILVNNNKNQR